MTSTSGDPLTMRVEEAAGLLGISRGFAYELVNRGEIPALRFGRRIVVPRSALEELLASAGTTVTGTSPTADAGGLNAASNGSSSTRARRGMSSTDDQDGGIPLDEVGRREG